MVDSFDWRDTYDTLNSTPPEKHTRPVIGITGNYSDQTCTLAEGYYRSVLLSGGVPIIIPPYRETDSPGSQLDGLDGIIFSGGGDINPLFTGEEPLPALHSINAERDRQELLLARMAYDRQIPMLGICRGIQIMAAALGGELYQDIYTQEAGATLKHSQDLDRGTASHTVEIDEDTLLHRLFGDGRLAVNSFHHQAVKTVPKDFRVCARSCDGLIEAMESSAFRSAVGVQWHPECFCLNGDRSMEPLFDWLVGEARSFREAKELHSHILSLDSHCDTPMFFSEGIDFGRRDPKILVDLHKMTEGHLDATIMVAYLQQGARDDAALLEATDKAHGILSGIEQMVQGYGNHVRIAKTPAELYRNKAEGLKSIMLGIENGYAIGKDLGNIQAFRDRGVVYMTLCHNGDNDICGSAKKSESGGGGVTPFGEAVIREMNRTGMMVDLSHASERSFYNALEISGKPIVCSHSSARALCDSPRNLTDDQMRRLAAAGGVAQVTFYNGFLRTSGQATIIDALEHLDHMIRVMGIEHVGIGTDFDGDGGVPGLDSASALINFTRQLLARRYSNDDIELIWGKNFLRVMEEAQRTSEELGKRNEELHWTKTVIKTTIRQRQ